MRPAVHILHVVGSHLTLLVDSTVEIGSVVSLSVELWNGRRLDPVLVRGASNFLARCFEYVGGIVAAPGIRVFWS